MSLEHFCLFSDDVVEDHLDRVGTIDNTVIKIGNSLQEQEHLIAIMEPAEYTLSAFLTESSHDLSEEFLLGILEQLATTLQYLQQNCKRIMVEPSSSLSVQLQLEHFVIGFDRTCKLAWFDGVVITTTAKQEQIKQQTYEISPNLDDILQLQKVFRLIYCVDENVFPQASEDFLQLKSII